MKNLYYISLDLVSTTTESGAGRNQKQ